MARRLVVIGGDAGGMGAATHARRLDQDLEIVAFERTRYTSWSACGIPYLVAGSIANRDSLIVRSPEEHRARSGIDARTEHEVAGIDVRSRSLEVRDLRGGRSFSFGFDQLVIATGAVPIRPDLPGIELPFVRGVQTLADADALLDTVRRGQCQRVVVVGGGYIGLEMAEAFLTRGAHVTVVDVAPHVMNTLDADMARPLEQAMRQLGVELRLGATVEGFEPGVVQVDGLPVMADLVVLGLGVRPAAELADAAGIDTGVKGAVRVDRRQQTSVEGVWAAGDCVESFHRVSRQPVHIALGTAANRQARVAGINIGGGYAAFAGVVGTAVTRLCSLEIGRTGLNEREARAAGFDVEVGSIESTTTAGYLESAEPITVKLLAERGTGRLLGGQIVGGRGSAKRIDVIATALTARMTLDDVVDLDLGYAPPVSPLWDPVATAARALL